MQAKHDLTNPALWLPYAELATRFNVSIRTLQRLAANGEVRRMEATNRPRALLSVMDLEARLFPKEVGQ